MLYNKIRSAHIVIALSLLFLPVTSFAQHPSTLEGRLEVRGKDKMVANAVIHITHADSNRTYTITSDKKGHFIKPGLRSGMYNAVINCDGYEPLNVQGINIGTQEIVRIVLKLTPRP